MPFSDLMARKKPRLAMAQSGRFFRTFHEMFDSDAYRSLNNNERALLQELQARYLPNRCNIFLSTRRAAMLINVNKDTACRAFRKLEACGFIKLIKGALWQERKAREWRLTFESYNDREPTNDWKAISTSDPKSRDKLTQKKGQHPFEDIVRIETRGSF